MKKIVIKKGEKNEMVEKTIYNENGKEIYHEDSSGYWHKTQYDKNGNEIYHEDSNGYWHKKQYDEKGNKIYFENSKGYKYTFEILYEE